MIDDQFLQSLGLDGVNEDEKQRMITHIQETLQERIGARVETALQDEAKAQELDDLIANDNREAIKNWLAANVPNYQSIVTEETDKIKAEIQPQVAEIVQKYSSASA